MLAVLGVLAIAYLLVRPRLAALSRRTQALRQANTASEKKQQGLRLAQMESQRREQALRTRLGAGIATEADYAELAFLIRSRQPGEALTLLTEGAAKFPQSASLQANLGLVHQEAGVLDEALTHLKAAHALAPQDPRAAALLANLYLRLDWLPAARHVLDSLSDAARQDPNVAIARADLVLRSGDARAARDLLEPLTQAPGAPPSVWLLMGKLASLRGDAAAAVAEYEKALKGSPDSPQIRSQLGRALRAMHTPEATQRAVKLAREALAQHPRDPLASRSLGLALAEAEEYDEALEYLLPLAGPKQLEEVLLTATARALRAVGRKGEAKEVAARAARARQATERLQRLTARANVNPRDAEALLGLAQEYLLRDDRLMARLELGRLLEVRPNDPEALKLLKQAGAGPQ